MARSQHMDRMNKGGVPRRGKARICVIVIQRDQGSVHRMRAASHTMANEADG
jgi:hypothetical protein